MSEEYKKEDTFVLNDLEPHLQEKRLSEIQDFFDIFVKNNSDLPQIYHRILDRYKGKQKNIALIGFGVLIRSYQNPFNYLLSEILNMDLQKGEEDGN